MAVLQLRLNKNLFVKDPQSTRLGTNIIKYSIQLIDKLGFEAFTFKKLSIEIESTEASIYRYFENKHRVLIYLMTWYWAWLDHRLEFENANIQDAITRLDRAIKLITEKKGADPFFPEIDEEALHRIVIAELDKIYLTKQVDDDNREGLFRGFKSLCEKISSIIQEINPNYPFSHALISTTMEAANQQIFFARHLPSLTEVSNEADPFEANYRFLKSTIFKAIGVHE